MLATLDREGGKRRDNQWLLSCVLSGSSKPLETGWEAYMAFCFPALQSWRLCWGGWWWGNEVLWAIRRQWSLFRKCFKNAPQSLKVILKCFFDHTCLHICCLEGFKHTWNTSNNMSVQGQKLLWNYNALHLYTPYCPKIALYRLTKANLTTILRDKDSFTNG